jgi:hypothetical protein
LWFLVSKFISYIFSKLSYDSWIENESLKQTCF